MGYNYLLHALTFDGFIYTPIYSMIKLDFIWSAIILKNRITKRRSLEREFYVLIILMVKEKV